ncbi:hypothetical protein AYO38_06260 [bacterium SCGC AG-212-C10]|nr:hypothetical protein AYO38_06180 [bacterium SCGC AG-212-C10]OAI40217.1 hypothetical protein AYO38_06260 [bacterium SCGC AG-212-C10]
MSILVTGSSMLAMIVEDDPDYADVVANTLQWDRHDVVKIDSVAQAIAFSERKEPGLVVMADTMPDEPGVRLCTLLRQRFPRLPVILLGSSLKSQDVVAGLRAGADDYVQKPFNPAELLARVQAVLRRTGAESAKQQQESQVNCDGLVVDSRRQAAYLDGVGLSCTPIELDVLSQLARYPGEVLSHTFLTEQVWGYTEVANAALLKGHISSIRRKIRAAGGDESMIRTIHGQGYCLVPR